MAVPPVSAKPPVKRDEPTPTAVTPEQVAPSPTTPPAQAIYFCSAYCFADDNYSYVGQTFGSSTNDVMEAQTAIKSLCEASYQQARIDVLRDGYNIYRKILTYECKIHFVPPAVRFRQEPAKSEVPAEGEKTQN